MKNDRVLDTIGAGAVLIKDGTLLPETLHIEDEVCMPGWRLVQNLNGYALNSKIHEAGWTFFFLAGEVSAIAFGADEQSTARKAVKRILDNPKSKPFNSVQIARVSSKRFLGLPYISVRAHCRHIQEGQVLLCAKSIQKPGETGPTVTRAKPLDFISTNELASDSTNAQVSVAAPSL